MSIVNKRTLHNNGHNILGDKQPMYTIASSDQTTQSNFKYEFKLVNSIGTIATLKVPPSPLTFGTVDWSLIAQPQTEYEFNPDIINFESKTLNVIRQVSSQVRETYDGFTGSYITQPNVWVYNSREAIDTSLYFTNQIDIAKFLSKWEGDRYVQPTDDFTLQFFNGFFTTSNSPLNQFHKFVITLKREDGYIYVYETTSNPKYQTSTDVTTNLHDGTDKIQEFGCGPGNLRTFHVVPMGKYNPSTNLLYTDGNGAWDDIVIQALDDMEGYTSLPTPIKQAGSAAIIDIQCDDKYYKMAAYVNETIKSEVVKFNIINNYNRHIDPIQIAWENSVGGTDYFPFIKQSQKEKTVKKSTYQKNPFGVNSNGDLTKENFHQGAKIYDLDIETTYTLTSDWVDESASNSLQDLFDSENVYIRLSDGWYSAILKTNKIIDKKKPGLINYAIEVMLAEKVNQEILDDFNTFSPGTTTTSTTTPDSLTANFTPDKTSTYVGGGIDFTDTSSGNPDSWEWYFGGFGSNPSLSTAQNPTQVSWSQAGEYTIVLTANRSSDGESDTETKFNYVTIYTTTTTTTTP